MNPFEFAKLLAYIKENNGWNERMYVNNIDRKRRCIKYVDACFDTRDGTVWRVDFRDIAAAGGESNMSFRIEIADRDLKRIYDYLDEEIG